MPNNNIQSQTAQVPQQEAERGEMMQVLTQVFEGLDRIEAKLDQILSTEGEEVIETEQ